MTPAIHFREGGAADRDAILALRAAAFPHDDPEKRQPDFWKWEFADGYAGAGHIFVAEAGDRIVGHLGFVPQRYAVPQNIGGALAVDGMIHPDFWRRKVFPRLASFAAERLRNDFQLSTGFQIRPPSLAGMLAGGWREADKVPVLLKPLWSRSDTRPIAGIHPIGGGDLEQIDAMLSTSNMRQPRTLDFLRWRYLQNPYWRYQLDGFFANERLEAFVIHRETVLRRVPSLAIADAGGADDSLKRLIEHVCARSRVRIAAALLSRHHPAYGALRKSGFMRGPHRFRLLLQVFGEGVDNQWSLSWGDTDHL